MRDMNDIPSPVADRDAKRESQSRDLTARFLTAVDNHNEYHTEHYPTALQWIARNIHRERDARDLAEHFVIHGAFSDRQLLRIHAHVRRQQKAQMAYG